MTVKEIQEALGLQLVAGETGVNKEVTTGFAGDLLSVVMAKAKEGCVWLTIQSHINIIAVATLVEMSCIIITEGYELDLDAKNKADEEGIPILKTNASTFEVAKKLCEAGIA